MAASDCASMLLVKVMLPTIEDPETEKMFPASMLAANISWLDGSYTSPYEPEAAPSETLAPKVVPDRVRRNAPPRPVEFWMQDTYISWSDGLYADSNALQYEANGLCAVVPDMMDIV
jgi:hypothetical protein